MLPLNNVLLLDILMLDNGLLLGVKLLLLLGDVLLLRNSLLLDGVLLLDVLLKMFDETNVLVIAVSASAVLAVFALTNPVFH